MAREIDWEKIELDYRAGIKTLREIAKEHGIAHGSITNKAKKEGWARDLSAKIRAKADEIVSKKLASKKLASKKASKNKQQSEIDCVQANADNSAEIQIQERDDVSKARKLTMSLFNELKSLSDNTDLAEALSEAVGSRDSDDEKIMDAVKKITALPGRIKCMKDLTDALKIQIELERKVHKIDDANVPGAGFLKMTVEFE